MLSNWMQSTSNVNLASFTVLLEIAKKGRPLAYGKYVKDCFIRASEELTPLSFSVACAIPRSDAYGFLVLGISQIRSLRVQSTNIVGITGFYTA